MMQNFIDIAAKNGVILLNSGNCQFCGAATTGGVYECVEIFNNGFHLIDYSKAENYIYRFIGVDAHTLQHPEIHGRWNNHFHLTRQHLIFNYHVQWNYQLSPKLSVFLNLYKLEHRDENFEPPKILERGKITATDILQQQNEEDCRQIIIKWGKEVYNVWSRYHEIADNIADGFINKNRGQLSFNQNTGNG